MLAPKKNWTRLEEEEEETKIKANSLCVLSSRQY